jgi:hypothetical protein
MYIVELLEARITWVDEVFENIKSPSRGRQRREGKKKKRN